MNLKKIFLLMFLIVLSKNSLSSDTLTGLEKLSCEAILCLSTGSPPGECNPALNYYYSLKAKKWKNTLKKRINFLNICPSGSSPGMPSLISAIANGAGRCDKSTLLSMLNPKYSWDGDGMSWTQGKYSSIPGYCSVYYNHSWTVLGSLPTKLNPPGKCFDYIESNSDALFPPKPDIVLNGRGYKLINIPSWMDDVGSDVQCFNLWN